MFPSSWFAPTSRYLRWFNKPILEGNSPLKLLFPKDMYTRFDNSPIHEGKSPEILLSNKNNPSKKVKFFSSSGKTPATFTESSASCITWPSSTLTPASPQQSK